MKKRLLFLFYLFNTVSFAQTVYKFNFETVSDPANNKQNKIHQMKRQSYSVNGINGTEKPDVDESYQETYNTNGEIVELLIINNFRKETSRQTFSYENGNCKIDYHITRLEFHGTPKKGQENSPFSSDYVYDTTKVDTIYKNWFLVKDKNGQTLEHTYSQDQKAHTTKNVYNTEGHLIEKTSLHDTTSFTYYYETRTKGVNETVRFEYYLEYMDLRVYTGKVEYKYDEEGRILSEAIYEGPSNYYDVIDPMDLYFTLHERYEYTYHPNGKLASQIQLKYDFFKKKNPLQSEEISYFDEQENFIYFATKYYRTKTKFDLSSSKFQWSYNTDGSIKEQIAIDENNVPYHKWIYTYTYFK